MAKRLHQPMMQPKGRKHPSGNRQDDQRWGVRSVERVPLRGSLTPSLRRDERTYAVGFTAQIGGNWDNVD